MARALALLLLTSLCGCAALRADPDPDAVRVEALAARFDPGDRADFTVKLKVQNPGLPLARVSGVDWEIWLRNRRFASGTSRLDQALPDKGAQQVELMLPVVFRRALPGSPDPAELQAAIRGSLEVQSPAGDVRLPFHAQERVTAAYAPAAERDEP